MPSYYYILSLFVYILNMLNIFVILPFFQIRALAEAGVKVVVCSGKVGDMALHFLNKHHLMVVRLISKFDLLRVSEAVGARVLCNLKPPLKEVPKIFILNSLSSSFIIIISTMHQLLKRACTSSLIANLCPFDLIIINYQLTRQTLFY